MSNIRINSISIKNYRSFKDGQDFSFPGVEYLKPTAIVGYNNSGKTNLMSAILYGIGEKFISEKTFEKIDLHNLDLDNQIQIHYLSHRLCRRNKPDFFDCHPFHLLHNQR